MNYHTEVAELGFKPQVYEVHTSSISLCYLLY